MQQVRGGGEDTAGGVSEGWTVRLAEELALHPEGPHQRWCFGAVGRMDCKGGMEQDASTENFALIWTNKWGWSELR